MPIREYRIWNSYESLIGDNSANHRLENKRSDFRSFDLLGIIFARQTMRIEWKRIWKVWMKNQNTYGLKVLSALRKIKAKSFIRCLNSLLLLVAAVVVFHPLFLTNRSFHIAWTHWTNIFQNPCNKCLTLNALCCVWAYHFHNRQPSTYSHKIALRMWNRMQRVYLNFDCIQY